MKVKGRSLDALRIKNWIPQRISPGDDLGVNPRMRKAGLSSRLHQPHLEGEHRSLHSVP
jgi:hypothetical protein